MAPADAISPDVDYPENCAPCLRRIVQPPAYLEKIDINIAIADDKEPTP